MSLQTRITALVQAIGVDIKALYSGKVDNSEKGQPEGVVPIDETGTARNTAYAVGPGQAYGAYSVLHTLDHINYHAYEDWSVLNPLEANKGYASFDAKPSLNNALDEDHFVGFQSRPLYKGSGDITGYLAAFDTNTQHTGTGTVVHNYGVLVRNTGGSGPITNNYGIYIAALTRGVKNFAVYCAGGVSYFKNAIGVNTETPSGVFHGVAEGDCNMFLDSFGANSNGALTFQRKARGTVAAPTAVQGGDFIGGLAASGHDGTAMSSRARTLVLSLASENWSATSQGAEIALYTSPNGTLSILERVRVANNGNVGLGVTVPTAVLHLKAGTAAAGTAPVKFSTGVLNTNPESGALEFDGTDIHITSGSSRRRLAVVAAALAKTAAVQTSLLSDSGQYLRFTNTGASTYTIAAQSSVAWADNTELTIRRAAAASLTLVAGSGVTLNAPSGGTLILTNNMTVTLKRVAVNVWDVIGQTVAA